MFITLDPGDVIFVWITPSFSLQQEQPIYLSTNIGNCDIENWQLQIQIRKDQNKFFELKFEIHVRNHTKLAHRWSERN